MRNILLIVFFVLFTCTLKGFSQEEFNFYIRANIESFNPSLSESSGKIVYTGKDKILQELFSKNNIYRFERAFSNYDDPILNRTWHLRSDELFVLEDFLETGAKYFEKGVYRGEIYLADYYPDDYGTTIPVNSGVVNLGIEAEQDYFDYIGLPQAWDYATGENIVVGISDGRLPHLDNDFNGANKLTEYSIGCTSESNCGYHGYTVGALLAAQGNNSYGTTGVAFNSKIYSTAHGDYDNLKQLAVAGAKVINCSWGWTNYCQEDEIAIQDITNLGVVVVAASHNRAWNPPDSECSTCPTGPSPYFYPASFENVISVGAVGHKRELHYNNIDIIGNNNTLHIPNVKDFVGGSVRFTSVPTPSSDLENIADISEDSTASLNDQVDILAPGGSILRYNQFVLNNTVAYTSDFFKTSAATPLVSGTIALMFEVNECLTFSQVESILKATSKYIGDRAGNLPFEGNYGSGSLNAGRAVKLANDLLDSSEIAFIENQKFTRWDFEFKGVSQHVEIRNQEFTESSTLNVIARNRILIEEDSLLEPNSDGNILLEIDPSLIINTDCLPNGVTSPADNNGAIKDKEDDSRYKVAPTKVIDEMTIYEGFLGVQNLKSIKIYDLMNREVFARTGLELNRDNKVTFNLQLLKRGIYIVKGYSSDGETIITEKIIKM